LGLSEQVKAFNMINSPYWHIKIFKNKLILRHYYYGQYLKCIEYNPELKMFICDKREYRFIFLQVLKKFVDLCVNNEHPKINWRKNDD